MTHHLTARRDWLCSSTFVSLSWYMSFYKRTGRTETEDNRSPKMSKSKVYNQSTSSGSSLNVSSALFESATNKAPEECNVTTRPPLPDELTSPVQIKIQLRHHKHSRHDFFFLSFPATLRGLLSSSRVKKNCSSPGVLTEPTNTPSCHEHLAQTCLTCFNDWGPIIWHIGCHNRFVWSTPRSKLESGQLTLVGSSGLEPVSNKFLQSVQHSTPSLTRFRRCPRGLGGLLKKLQWFLDCLEATGCGVGRFRWRLLLPPWWSDAYSKSKLPEVQLQLSFLFHWHTGWV